MVPVAEFSGSGSWPIYHIIYNMQCMLGRPMPMMVYVDMDTQKCAFLLKL